MIKRVQKHKHAKRTLSFLFEKIFGKGKAAEQLKELNKGTVPWQN